MEQDREVDQVLMNVRNSAGSMISISLISARISYQLLVFLMRLAKKGMVAAGFADQFKNFTEKTEGNYTVYNIPLSANRIQNLKEINELELKVQNTNNPVVKSKLRNEIKQLRKEIPELEQIEKLGINHCVLPKLNGSEQTIQIAVDKKNDQMFKNWFLNHLTAELSGGKKSMEELKVFTEGNYTIFNLPFEGEEMESALSDFNILDMNYAIMPDLKVGDGNSQIAIPNADRGKIETWFTMWRDKQLREGKEPGEMYAMNQESYMETGNMEAGEYVAGAEQQYKDANAEFEAQSKEVPWAASMQKENSEEYVRLLKNQNYEKITINEETLVNNMEKSTKAEEMERNGYFISRVPGTYKENQQTLILPKDKVFTTDNEKTYVAFLPKNQKSMIVDNTGNVCQKDFQEIYQPYAKVERSMRKVEQLQKGISPAKTVLPKIPKSVIPK